jgi:hypothetical protein
MKFYLSYVHSIPEPKDLIHITGVLVTCILEASRESLLLACQKQDVRFKKQTARSGLVTVILAMKKVLWIVYLLIIVTPCDLTLNSLLLISLGCGLAIKLRNPDQWGVHIFMIYMRKWPLEDSTAVEIPVMIFISSYERTRSVVRYWFG